MGKGIGGVWEALEMLLVENKRLDRRKVKRLTKLLRRLNVNVNPQGISTVYSRSSDFQ